MGLSEKVIWLA